MSLNIEVLNNLSFKETIDFESYVTAHTEYINYNKYTDAASTMISFVGSKNQTPSKNLRIKDLSWKHPKNNLNYILEFDETKQNFVFITPYKELYITNVLGENKEPLFFKHKKKFNKNSEIRITKRINGENIEEDISGIKEWRFLNGYVYNNFLNKFKSETGAYETYFVSGVDEQGKSINELLSNEEAIEELSWRDIDPDDGSISRSGYSKNQKGSGFEFTISLSEEEACSENLNTVYIKSKNLNVIKILPPEGLGLNEDWFLRIQNGFFYGNKKYEISEFLLQNFNPEIGIIKLYKKECFFIGKNESSHLIKVPIENLKHSSEENMYINVFVYDENDILIKALTSNNSSFGKKVNNTSVLYEEGIKSVDEKGGFVELNSSILFKQKILCDFHHKTESYFLTKLNLNPLINEKILSSNYFIYLKPNKNIGEKSLEWLVFNNNGIIIDCTEDNLKEEIKNEEGRFIFNPNTILGKSIAYFEESYCYGYDNTKEYLALGEVSYKDTEYLEDIFEFDLKDNTPINDENYKDIINRKWKILQSKYGFGEEGVIYQNNNIVYVKAPKWMLYEYGGSYSEEELYDLLKSKLNICTEIIFDWDYYDLNIKLDNSISGKVHVATSWEGQGRYVLKKRTSSWRNQDEILFEQEYNERPEDDWIHYMDENANGNVYYFYTYNDQQSPIAGIRVR